VVAQLHFQVWVPVLYLALNLEMQLHNHISRSEIQSSSQLLGVEMQLTIYFTVGCTIGLLLWG
jgi:hypothetical protein